MKKCLVLLIAVVCSLMCIVLAGCGDSDSSGSNGSTEYDLKVKLNAAKSNASLVFKTALGAGADFVADGGSASDIKPSGGVLKVSDMAGSPDPIKKAVYEALKQNGADDGYVYWTVNEKGSIDLAQWSEEKSGIIGQYPNYETDPHKTHTIGEEFEVGK